MTGKDLVSVEWRSQGDEKSLHLGPGKYTIGNSTYASIFVAENTQQPGVAAVLMVGSDRVELRCVGDCLPIHYRGRSQQLGEVIRIGLSAVIVFGRTQIRVERLYTDTNRDAAAGLALAQLGWVQGQPHTLRAYVSEQLLEALKSAGIDLTDLESAKVRSQIQVKLKEVIDGLNLNEEVEGIDVKSLAKQVFDEVIGLGPLEDLLADSKVSEIMVNSYNQIYVERGGHLTLSPVVFSSEKSLLAVIERIVSTVGRRIDTSSPICDARLLDGSRVNAVIQPIALHGACLTIRRFPEHSISVDELVEWGSMTAFMRDFFSMCVRMRLNIMISGGTGSGKTTLLNALSGFIPEDERIITVEDTAELQLRQPHVISLETRPPNIEGRGAITIRDLVKNCLRMRPDRIVVGECRGGEALDMLQAMNTGHDGSLSTAHANTPDDMLRRLETMVLMAGVEFPLLAIREQVASAVQLIVQQTRLNSGRRLITEVSYIMGLDRESGKYISSSLIKLLRIEGTSERKRMIYPQRMKEMAGSYSTQLQLQEIFEKHQIAADSEELEH